MVKEVTNSEKIDENLVVSRGTPMPDQAKKLKGAFSQISRELSESDLNAPGTQRLILNELHKYEDCKVNLEFYRDKYHELDKQCAIYKEKLNTHTMFELICSTMFAVGPALMTLSPSIEDKDGHWYYLSTIILILGIVILMAGVVSKFIQHRKS